MNKDIYTKSLLEKLKENGYDSPYLVVSEYNKLIDKELETTNDFNEVIKKIGDVDSVVSKYTTTVNELDNEIKNEDIVIENNQPIEDVVIDNSKESINDKEIEKVVEEDVVEDTTTNNTTTNDTVNTNNTKVGFGTHLKLFFLRIIRFLVGIVQFTLRLVIIIAIVIYGLVFVYDRVNFVSIANDEYYSNVVEVCDKANECNTFEISYSSSELNKNGILKAPIIRTMDKDTLSVNSQGLQINDFTYTGIILPFYLESAIIISVVFLLNAMITVGITRKLKNSIKVNKRKIRGVSYE